MKQSPYLAIGGAGGRSGMSGHGAPSGHAPDRRGELPYFQAAIFALMLLAAGLLVALVVASACVWSGILSTNLLLNRDLTPQKIVFALNWVAPVAILWREWSGSARSMAIAAGAVLAGAALGLATREVMLSGVVQPDWVGAFIFLALLTALVWHTMQRLNGEQHGEFDVNAWLAKAIVPGAFGFAFLVALLFGSYFATSWNETLGPIVGWRFYSGSDLQLALANELADIVNNTRDLFSAIFAVASSVTTIVVAYYVTPQLGTLWTYLGLKKDELHAASLLRSAASEAVLPEDRLGLKYTKQVNITPDSNPRQMPLTSRDGSRAIIKIFMPEERGGEAFSALKDMVATAEIELENSLFFIYSDKDFQTARGDSHDAVRPEVLAYGTGAELKDLLLPTTWRDRGRFSGLFTERFVAALQAGDKMQVQNIVLEARKFALGRNPKDDVMLTTVSVPASMELKRVMRYMGKEGLNRILLTSDKVPHEFAILDLEDVSRYLLPSDSDDN